jgi:hypothetical protein
MLLVNRSLPYAANAAVLALTASDSAHTSSMACSRSVASA